MKLELQPAFHSLGLTTVYVSPGNGSVAAYFAATKFAFALQHATPDSTLSLVAGEFPSSDGLTIVEKCTSIEFSLSSRPFHEAVGAPPDNPSEPGIPLFPSFAEWRDAMQVWRRRIEFARERVEQVIQTGRLLGDLSLTKGELARTIRVLAMDVAPARELAWDTLRVRMPALTEGLVFDTSMSEKSRQLLVETIWRRAFEAGGAVK